MNGHDRLQEAVDHAMAQFEEALSGLAAVMTLLDDMPTRLVAEASLAVRDAQEALEEMRDALRDEALEGLQQ